MLRFDHLSAGFAFNSLFPVRPIPALNLAKDIWNLKLETWGVGIEVAFFQFRVSSFQFLKDDAKSHQTMWEMNSQNEHVRV